MSRAGPLDREDLAALAAEWARSEPFRHVVLDDATGADRLDALRRAVASEPHWPECGELIEAMASAPDLQHPVLRDYAAALGSPATLAAAGRVTGHELRSVQVRSYVYLPGGYLLPHTDHRPGLGRKVAWVHYLAHDGTCEGGELELFACSTDASGEIVATESARRIEPRADRLVMFEVSPISLHRVREVRAGARASLAGWFL